MTPRQGSAPEQWLGTLASAGVPAFLCTRIAGATTIVARTPEYAGLLQVLLGRFDETDLLARLDAAWPAGTGTAPFVIAADVGPDWRCVLRVVDDAADTYLGILRLPDELRVPNDAFYTIVEHLPDVVIRHDRQLRCVYVNAAIEEVTGIAAGDCVGEVHRSDVLGDYVARLDVVVNGQPMVAEFDCAGPRGLRHYLGRAVPEFDHQGRVSTTLSYIHDITDLKRLQSQLELMARTDPLTGLLNRRGLAERIDPELERVRCGRGELTLLMLDLDDFKSVNDRFGHPAGDRILAAVGRILLDEAGSRHFAARLGGDEFVMALVDAGPDDAGLVADRIRRRVAELEPMPVQASIGTASAEPGDSDGSELVARMDRLVYEAKSAKR